MSWNLLVNILFAGLLGAGVYYAWRLQDTLKNFSRDRAEIEKATGNFSVAITRAEKAITELRATSRDLSLEIDQQMSRAQSLRDELSFLTDTADKIAARLTDVSTQAQSASKPSKAPLRPVAEEKPPSPDPPATTAETIPVPAWARRAGSDAVVINKPSATTPKAEAVGGPAKEKAEKKDLPRSQAERELMQALEKIQ